jgi:hypothetical protein
MAVIPQNDIGILDEHFRWDSVNISSIWNIFSSNFFFVIFYFSPVRLFLLQTQTSVSHL